MIYSATGGADAAHLLDADLRASASASSRWSSALAIDYRSLADKSHFIYLGADRCCWSYVLFFGVVRGGSRRWIDLGVFNLQPSEFAKATLALVLAKLLRREPARRAQQQRPVHRRRAHGACRSLLDRPAARPRHGGDAAARSSSSSPSSPGMPMRISAIARARGRAGWRRSRGSSRSRTIRRNASRRSWIPSRMRGAPGTSRFRPASPSAPAGVWGKGFMQGTQGQLRFLPVAHNDFIFSVLAEEQGFVGVLVALGLYLFVIMRSLEAARLAKDRLGAYLVLGVLASFTFQVDLQHHDVGGPGAGQGLDAAAHELRRLLHDRDAGGLRPHPQRADAPVHELSGRRRQCRCNRPRRRDLVVMCTVTARRCVLRAPAGAIDEQGNDHLLERPRNTVAILEDDQRRRNLRRARAQSRRRRQRLQGPGLQSAARHAVRRSSTSASSATDSSTSPTSSATSTSSTTRRRRGRRRAPTAASRRAIETAPRKRPARRATAASRRGEREQRPKPKIEELLKEGQESSCRWPRSRSARRARGSPAT